MKTITSITKHITIERIILVLAAAYAAYNFGLVGGYVEHGEGGRFSAGGFAAGIVVNVSLAIAASRFGSLTGKARTRQATIAFVGMMILAPAVVAPVIYYSLPADFLGGGFFRALWALAYPLVADLAIVLAGSVTGKGLIALSEDKPQGTAQSDAGAGAGAPTASVVRGQKKRSADALRDECAALAAQYACTEPQCGWSPSVDALMDSARAGKSAKAAASGARAGHYKNRHPKPIQIDQSLLLPAKKDGER